MNVFYPSDHAVADGAVSPTSTSLDGWDYHECLILYIEFLVLAVLFGGGVGGEITTGDTGPRRNVRGIARNVAPSPSQAENMSSWD